MAKTYYKNGVWQVTDEFVKARGRSIQLSTLESIDLSRKVFFMTVGFGGCLVLFAVAYIDILRFMEIIIALLIAGGALYLSWNVATLTIYSKLTGHKGWSVTGWASSLFAMRSAIEQALEDRAKRPRRNRGGAVAEDDEEGEADE